MIPTRILAVLTLACAAAAAENPPAAPPKKAAESSPSAKKEAVCLYPSNADPAFQRFVLTDYDFKQLANYEPPKGEPALTKAYFLRLSPTKSILRRQICDSRALWRKIQTSSSTVTNDDFTTTFPRWISAMWGKEEQKKVLEVQIDIAARNWN